MLSVLGDTHNFGRAVTLINESWIYKPKPLFWEYMFLSASSPLRLEEKQLARQWGVLSRFCQFPNLKFSNIENLSSFEGGKVQRLSLQPVNDLSNKDSEKVGATLAIVSWFGISDLHTENMAIGRDYNGNFIFAPIDIETVFDKFEVLSQSQVVGSFSSALKLLGCVDILKKEPNVAAVCFGFRDSLKYFERISDDLDKVFLKDKRTFSTPSRIVLKDTSQYLDHLKNQPSAGNSFFEEEVIQLNRGEVPYFFSFIGQNKIFYLRSEAEKKEARGVEGYLDLLGDSFSLSKKEFLRGFTSQWIKQALLQIARTFDPARDCIFEHEDLLLVYKGKSIFLTFGSEWRLKCRRLPASYFCV